MYSRDSDCTKENNFEVVEKAVHSRLWSRHEVLRKLRWLVRNINAMSLIKLISESS